jgi:hypothetical protein
MLWMVGALKSTFMIFRLEPLANKNMMPCTKFGYCKVHIWAINLHLKQREHRLVDFKLVLRTGNDLYPIHSRT